MVSLVELLAAPWAITEQAGRIMLEAARTGLDVKSLKSSVGPSDLFLIAPRENEPDLLDVRDGVAVIPIRGFLTRRSFWRGDRASYEWIGAQFDQAIERCPSRHRPRDPVR